MPGGDGTGPSGLGPMTGRRAGYCAGYSVPGYANPGFGRGLGFGRGRGWSGRGAGRGWRHWYWATGLPGWMRGYYGYPAYGPWGYPYNTEDLSPKDEMQMLKDQAESLKQELGEIQNRISTLEKVQKEGAKE